MANDLIKQTQSLFDTNGYPIVKDEETKADKKEVMSKLLLNMLSSLPDISYINVEDLNVPDSYILIKIGEKSPKGGKFLINPNMQSVITGEIIKVGSAVTKLKVGDTLLDYNPARGGMIVIKGVIYQSVREDNAVLWISK